MGSEKIILPKKSQHHGIMRDLIRDAHTLQMMIDRDMFERDVIRIGAEQEMCIVDRNWKPAMVNMEVLGNLNEELFTTELAKFNMEMNLTPLPFKGDCLSKMEEEILELLAIARVGADKMDTDVILTGILPTIRKYDLTLDSLTPIKRYAALVKSIGQLRGSEETSLAIRGIDELYTKHGSPMPEACNTGFQVHLQVTPEDFAPKYNIAQAIAGPALAVGTNSPLLFGKRLWHETRIALFQQSIDVRRQGHNVRHRSPRVMFGNGWVYGGILDLYREDITQFKIMLGSSEGGNSLEQLESGEVPPLNALMIHNSTIYRWNRPCYGVANGVPHLRIENRVLPSGPTVRDEMANAALWLGLMNGLGDVYDDITKYMDFSDAKDNFMSACRSGLNTKFFWANGQRYSAKDLINEELIPIARAGLAKAKVDTKDIDMYLDVIKERVTSGMNGSNWMLKSFSKLRPQNSLEEVRTAITASTITQQRDNKPVHTWKLASTKDLQGWQPESLRVEDFMQTDLTTVLEDEIVELAAEVMNWRKIRYVMVENKNNQLIGLLTATTLRRFLLESYYQKNEEKILVKDLMIKKPIVIGPEQSIREAIKLMQENNIGCLPVVGESKELLGVITEQDYLKVAGRLIYAQESND